MKSVSRVMLGVFLAVLMCFAMGCASLRHATYKEEYITGQIQDYVYTSDNFSEVWSKARQLLFESGYQVRDSGGGYNVETEWAWVGDNERRRYLVSTYAVNNNTGYVVHFDYVDETDNGGSYPYTKSGRDYVMEFELLKRANYAQWKQIDSAAESYADQRVAAEK